MHAHEISAVATSAPDAWSTPSPTLPRRVLAVGTTIGLPSIRRPIAARELAWLHAALTKRLGHSHEAWNRWSVMPWQCESGCAVVWWDARDGLALAGTRARSRIGSIDTDLVLGPLVRIHAPPQWLAGAYPVRLTTRSLVTIASVMRRGENAGKRIARTRAESQTIESALATLASKLGVHLETAPAVRVLVDRTQPSSVFMRGKPRRVHGFEGSVDLLASAPARWLLECASRGLGLGARGAYGCGAVTVEAMG